MDKFVFDCLLAIFESELSNEILIRDNYFIVVLNNGLKISISTKLIDSKK